MKTSFARLGLILALVSSIVIWTLLSIFILNPGNEFALAVITSTAFITTAIVITGLALLSTVLSILKRTNPFWLNICSLALTSIAIFGIIYSMTINEIANVKSAPIDIVLPDHPDDSDIINTTSESVVFEINTDKLFKCYLNPGKQNADTVSLPIDSSDLYAVLYKWYNSNAVDMTDTPVTLLIYDRNEYDDLLTLIDIAQLLGVKNYTIVGASD